MSRRVARWRLAALGLVATLFGGLVAGCGLETSNTLPFDVRPGSIRAQPALEGQTITVGSKDFTENIVLAYIAEIALTAAGAQVNDLTNIQGSNSARQALLSGDIDLYWDYTGTGWINYLGNEQPIKNIQRQYEAVKAQDAKVNGITWLRYSAVNNHYAFAVNDANYAKLGKPKTVSDMTEIIKRDPSKGVLCLETEFASRPDGYPAMAEAYGIPESVERKNFGIGATYDALARGSCVFGEVFETDGRILSLNLHLLADDKAVLPQYSSSVTIRSDFLRQHPKIRTVLEPVAKKLDNDVMRDLNARVDVKGEDAAEVARDWMAKEGFIAGPNGA